MKISSGILGLDNLISGGIEQNSVCAVVGSTGTGKTITGLQFILDGLKRGDIGLYLSLEQSETEILKEGTSMWGDSVKNFVDSQKLIIYETDVEELMDTVRTYIPQLSAQVSSQGEKRIRIVIDPITPVLWHYKDRKDQRSFLKEMYSNLRQFCTSMVMVEHHGGSATIFNDEVAVPIFLADSAFLLSYTGISSDFQRSLRILKMRNSFHGEDMYSMQIVPHFGICIHDFSTETNLKQQDLIQSAITIAKRKATGSHKDQLITSLEKLAKENPQSYNEHTIDLLLKEHNLD